MSRVPQPDTVARWVCVIFGTVLIGTTTVLAAEQLVARDELHSPELWGGGVILGASLIWYGSRRPQGRDLMRTTWEKRPRRRPPTSDDSET